MVCSSAGSQTSSVCWLADILGLPARHVVATAALLVRVAKLEFSGVTLLSVAVYVLVCHRCSWRARHRKRRNQQRRNQQRRNQQRRCRLHHVDEAYARLQGGTPARLALRASSVSAVDRRCACVLLGHMRRTLRSAGLCASRAYADLRVANVPVLVAAASVALVFFARSSPVSFGLRARLAPSLAAKARLPRCSAPLSQSCATRAARQAPCWPLPRLAVASVALAARALALPRIAACFALLTSRSLSVGHRERQ